MEVTELNNIAYISIDIRNLHLGQENEICLCTCFSYVCLCRIVILLLLYYLLQCNTTVICIVYRP